MTLTVKLLASLIRFLPEGTKGAEAVIEVDDALTIDGLLDHFGMQQGQSHMIVVNGDHVALTERAAHALHDGDSVTVWPNMAGG